MCVSSIPMVRLNRLTKRFGDILAIDDLSLDVGKGEWLTLLGPTGGGKTTTLRLIGGFEEPTSGEVYIDGQNMRDVPPSERKCSMVFQDLALFPHQTVAQNVEYGLRVRRIPKAERRRRCEEVLKLVSLEGLQDRNVLALSGGQRQRVAVARSLVIQPSVLLLDEPIKDLDEKLRKHMQTELRKIHDEIGTTFVYVTHHQEEALSMSDRVAILRSGRVEQVDTPENLLRFPRTQFVAELLAANTIETSIEGERDGFVEATFGDSHVIVSKRGSINPKRAGVLVLRPARVRVGASAQGCKNRLNGVIDQVMFKGRTVEYHLTVGDRLHVTAETIAAGPIHSSNEKVAIGFDPEDAILIDVP